jgi:hypothetical protein
MMSQLGRIGLKNVYISSGILPFPDRPTNPKNHRGVFIFQFKFFGSLGLYSSKTGNMVDISLNKVQTPPPDC